MCPSWELEQSYAVLEGGGIVSIHALISEDHFAGDLAFIPSQRGAYRFRGAPYSKPYLTNGRGAYVATPPIRPVASDIAPCLWELVPTKSIVNWRDVVEVITCERMLALAIERHDDAWFAVYSDVLSIFGSHADRVVFALTGSLGLMDSRSAPNDVVHDVDIVLTAELDEINTLSGLLQDYSLRHLESRLFEYGKSWRIRIGTAGGVICPFFRWASPARSFTSAPRQSGSLEPLMVRGLVTDARQGVLMPAVYTIDAQGIGEVDVVFPTLRARGDFVTGDRMAVEGILSKWNGRPSIFVVDETQKSLLTPPWLPYYE